jgi:hypothetical protein
VGRVGARGTGGLAGRVTATPGRAGESPAALGWLAAVFASLVLTVIVGTEERMPVILPIMAATGCAAAFCWTVWRQKRDGFPYFEVGVVYVAVVWLYIVFPLVGFLVNGLRYSRFNDLRLFVLQPSAAEVGGIGWLGTAHLGAFVAAYLLWRGRTRVREGCFPAPDRATVVAAFFAYVMIQTYFLLLGQFFDLSAKTYAESFLVPSRLPLELAQVANHLGGAGFILELVILAALFADYARWRLLIAGWLMMTVVVAFVQRGGRTEVVLLLAAAAIMYHHAVRPLRLRHVVFGAATGLSMFLLLGFLRFVRGPEALMADVNPIFGHVNEFETILSNAYGLSRLKASGALDNIPIAFYLSDLLALIPQQVLPITKVSPAVWYVTTFFPDHAAMGAAFAFGTIAESIAGGGWLDAMGRGATLGLALATIHRYLTRRRPTFWRFIFYVWVTVSVYQSFRATTFILIGLIFYRFLPVAMGVKTLAGVLRNLPRTLGAWPRVGSEQPS